jgi:hypothetical protein
MTNIYQKTDFVYYTLDQATNAQLKFLGLKPSQRDGLMEKELLLGNFHHMPWAMTALDKDLSHTHRKTFINHVPFYGASETDQNFLIAHEIYNAAKFWDKSAVSKIKNSLAPAFKFSLFFNGALNGLMGDPSVALACAGALTAGGVYSNTKAYRQEKAASRFAYLMEPEFYHQELQEVPKVSFAENVKSILGGDPTEIMSERHFRQAINECHQGNPLFPQGRKDYDAAFEDSQKPRLIITIGFR